MSSLQAVTVWCCIEQTQDLPLTSSIKHYYIFNIRLDTKNTENIWFLNGAQSICWPPFSVITDEIIFTSATTLRDKT